VKFPRKREIKTFRTGLFCAIRISFWEICVIRRVGSSGETVRERYENAQPNYYHVPKRTAVWYDPAAIWTILSLNLVTSTGTSLLITSDTGCPSWLSLLSPNPYTVLFSVDNKNKRYRTWYACYTDIIRYMSYKINDPFGTTGRIKIYEYYTFKKPLKIYAKRGFPVVQHYY